MEIKHIRTEVTCNPADGSKHIYFDATISDELYYDMVNPDVNGEKIMLGVLNFDLESVAEIIHEKAEQEQKPTVNGIPAHVIHMPNVLILKTEGMEETEDGNEFN